VSYALYSDQKFNIRTLHTANERYSLRSIETDVQTLTDVLLELRQSINTPGHLLSKRCPNCKLYKCYTTVERITYCCAKRQNPFMFSVVVAVTISFIIRYT
jgi:hypothetical protein